MRKYILILWWSVLLIPVIGCEGESVDPPPSNCPPICPPEPSNFLMTTDRSIYAPGEAIEFTLEGTLPADAKIRYKHLAEVIGESILSGNSWSYNPPMNDYRGYMAEVFVATDDEEDILATVGFDVSSDWTRFPRYGFLSKFPKTTTDAIDQVIENLKRHHINGLQFYDWHYMHHLPLPGSAENPDESWKDIINRDIYFETVEGYIKSAHAKGMKAMHYNLIFGALEGAEDQGVSPEWFMYRDNTHKNKDYHGLPQPPFVSNIFLLDPANTNWQSYLVDQNSKVYAALDFDGFHMDQLGDRDRTLYTYEGNTIDLTNTFSPFIGAMKDAEPDKALVLNAVNQYGQETIATAPTHFLYSEVWAPNERFYQLAQVLLDNNEMSNGQKNSVLAAYMNYNLADQPGYFNTPAVLLTDAVIFAFGGAHLELGEHMLGKEYFPNNNLKVKDDLEEDLVEYYDFLVAYQNLLRNGGTFNDQNVSGYGQMSFNSWPPETGSVATVGKLVGDRQVIHLLNFTDATTLNWRDNQGQQSYPEIRENIRIAIATSKTIKNVWLASPDYKGGSAIPIEFKQQANQVTLTLPYLEFWDMIVLE